MERIYSIHKDYNVLGIKEAIVHVYDEIKECIEEPSMDELSDVAYGINRLFGAICRVKYIGIMPFDKRHIIKCNARYKEYGHFRSRRHLN